MINTKKLTFKPYAYLSILMAVITAVFMLLTPSPGIAANFSITPTSLDLEKNVRSGVFSVINSGNEKLNVQISVKEWGQDADGKDVYADTKDIVFFPKIMTVEPNEQRAIRIGIKSAPSPVEKTYRLFVEEIPLSKNPTVTGSGKIAAGLTIAFRYATPIFVKPLLPQESGIVEKVEMSKGICKTIIRNTGNIHIKVLSVKFKGLAVDGKELFSMDSAGWYILHSLSRSYEVKVPAEVCGKLATLEVSAQSENLTFNGTLHVQKTMCSQ